MSDDEQHDNEELETGSRNESEVPENPDDSIPDSTADAEDDLSDVWGDALAEQAEVDNTGGLEKEPPQNIAPATYEEVRQDEDTSPGFQEDVNLDVILDIPVTLSMEIGRTKISIRNLLQLNQGSVVELDRLAGDAMDVLVNGTLVAHGEVVVVNDKFGIRLTNVISPAERVRRLR